MERVNPFPTDDLVLMSSYADVAFTYDGRGRMLRSNEPREEERRPAPRLYLGYTISDYIVRFGATVPDALVRQLREMMDREPPVTDLHASPPVLTGLREVLEQHTPITQVGGGPVYRFPEQRRVAKPDDFMAFSATSAHPRSEFALLFRVRNPDGFDKGVFAAEKQLPPGLWGGDCGGRAQACDVVKSFVSETLIVTGHRTTTLIKKPAKPPMTQGQKTFRGRPGFRGTDGSRR